MNSRITNSIVDYYQETAISYMEATIMLKSKTNVFWETALSTSSELTATLKNEQYIFNHVIYPEGIINALK